MTIFHEAARDGNLDILREATRRDCDKADEDGMTPVLWAAYHGNLDALRTLSIRGGNPDKCDYLGNSALHLAAANGHLNCVSYLVSFGSNLWSLDNDFHTPLDIAGLNDRSEIVKFLDSISATQSMRNKKLVKKFKEKAILSAQKRVKKYSKLQAKAQKKADRDDKKMAEVREKMLVDNSPHSAPASVYSTLRGDRLAKMTLSSQKTTTSEPKPYSAHFTINSVNGRRLLGGNVAKKIKDRRDNGMQNPDFKIREQEVDGTKTIKSLSGLKRDSQIMYTNKNQRERALSTSKPIKSDHVDDIYMNAKNKEDAISRAVSEPDFTNINEDSGIESNDSTPHEGVGMFERPGFGTVAFINRRTTGALMSLPWQTEHDDEDGEDDDTEDQDQQSTDIPNGTGPPKSGDTITNGKTSLKSKKSRKGKHSSVRRKGSCTDSIGTLGSLAVRISDVPWDESDIDCLDDDDVLESSPLELFLYSCGLTEFFSTFTREKIDLDALMLLSESDMKDLGLPLGPRKKLADAVWKRKSSMMKPGVIFDTRL